MSNLESTSNFIFYTTDNGNFNIQVALDDDTVWATQKSMSEIFETTPQNITQHIKNIYKEQELDEQSTCKKILQVQQEGNRSIQREFDFYNLDMLIAVGYRVNSLRATQFRKWATNTLKEYLIKGFVLDDDRLKQGRNLTNKDYFRELLERIRSTRASERRIWQQITDIFAECSIDYAPNSSITEEFYSMVQNKFHYAITGQTAAEIIYSKTDKNKDNM